MPQPTMEQPMSGRRGQTGEPVAVHPAFAVRGGVTDERAQRILDEVLAYPGVPASLASLDATAPLLPIVPVRFARGDQRFDFFSTVTTLGTPQDVTLQELRIECFFPANDATRSQACRLADAHVA